MSTSASKSALSAVNVHYIELTSPSAPRVVSCPSS